MTDDSPTAAEARSRPWRPWRSKVIWALLIGVTAAAVSDLRVVRQRDAESLTRIRQLNRRWVNPLVLRLAGGRIPVLARLEHRGRRSGALRATPVLAEPVSEGFLVTMPYGSEVDWARNLLHSGVGVIQQGGVRYRVANPRIVSTVDALPELPHLTGFLINAAGISELMRLDVLPNLTAETPPPA